MRFKDRLQCARSGPRPARSVRTQCGRPWSNVCAAASGGQALDPAPWHAATFGFVDNAERLNSRACMIGFFVLIALEAVLGKGFLATIGLSIGQGLGFEF